MSIIKEIKFPILTNPFLSPKVRNVLGRLLDSIDQDLDANEYEGHLEGVTSDLLREYNQALVDETPEEEIVYKIEDGDEFEVTRVEMFEDFNKREKSQEDEVESSRDELLENFDDSDSEDKG